MSFLSVVVWQLRRLNLGAGLLLVKVEDEDPVLVELCVDKLGRENSLNVKAAMESDQVPVHKTGVKKHEFQGHNEWMNAPYLLLHFHNICCGCDMECKAGARRKAFLLPSVTRPVGHDRSESSSGFNPIRDKEQQAGDKRRLKEKV